MRSDFEKNRYWIGLFKTDVEFNGLLGEFGRYELNGSREVNHSYLEDFNSKWEAYGKAWQHQQSKIDELQKRINDSQDIIESILARSLDNPEIQDLCGQLIDVLEHALKGGGE